MLCSGVDGQAQDLVVTSHGEIDEMLLDAVLQLLISSQVAIEEPAAVGRQLPCCTGLAEEQEDRQLGER